MKKSKTECYNFFVLVERVRNILNSILGGKKNPCLVIGVSGGPDSICLLDMLYRLKFDLVIAHFDHQIRENSSSDRDFVAKTAEKYGLLISSEDADIPTRAERWKTGIEETARESRHQFLFDVAKKEGADAVVTAHHADDQVETILMHLLRGSGTQGITGMQKLALTAYSDKVPLVRPLLTTWRSEILAYCDANDLDYVIDKSNRDTNYLRNRVRHELIPKLEEYNPKIRQTLLRMSENLSVEKNFTDRFVDDRISNLQAVVSEESFIFKLIDYFKMDEALQRLVIKRVLEKKFSDHIDISHSTILKIRDFFSGEFQSTYIPIGRKIRLIRDRKMGIITTDPVGISKVLWPSIENEVKIGAIPFSFRLNDYWELNIVRVDSGIDLEIVKKTSPFTAYINEKKIKTPLKIRNWYPGDRFSPIGMGGKYIKLSDFWINNKIPKIARESWPLILSKENIIWVPGLQVADCVKITQETDSILKMTVSRT